MRPSTLLVAPPLLLALTIAAGVIPVLRGDAEQQSPTPPPARPAASPFVAPDPLDYADHEGWTSIFDGRTLSGWTGNPEVWRVENGAITAESTAEKRVGSTHLIWEGGELADFEMKIEVRLDGDIHSGIAYRSVVAAPGPAATGAGVPRQTLHVAADPRWTLNGPGLDYDQDRKMAGNVEDRGTPRREIAWRGGIVQSTTGRRPRLIGTVGDADALMAAIKADDWNQVHIVARGHQLTHIINGQVMTVLFDDDTDYFRPKGLVGLQIEQWGVGRVNFRNIWVKRLPQGSGMDR